VSLLDVTGLSAGYGQIQVLRDVDFCVDEGEMVVLLGANGAGKTTTLRALCQMIETSGSVRFDGEELIGKRTEQVVRRGIGHVPQGRGTFPELSVAENLEAGAYVRKDKAGIRDDIERWFTMFPRLAERRAQAAGSLSGGEQQMLAVARALMSRPRMLLLDEPSLGLAPKLVKDIFEIIQRINREQGVTVLVVEQNASIALHTADYGYVLELGRIVMEDTCERLLQKDDIREFYLGLKESSVRGTRRWKRKKTWR
jgi:branched-chain amino acid transport system ATP-binding protein